jgi:hypothetical protein
MMLIGLGYVECTQPLVALVLLTLAVGLTAFQYSGFFVNHLDIAPAYAGILFGISNSVGSVAGFATSYVVGVITQEVIISVVYSFRIHCPPITCRVYIHPEIRDVVCACVQRGVYFRDPSILKFSELLNTHEESVLVNLAIFWNFNQLCINCICEILHCLHFHAYVCMLTM